MNLISIQHQIWSTKYILTHCTKKHILDRLFVWNEATQESEQIYSGIRVGGFTIQENGNLLLFREKDIALFDRNNKEIKHIYEVAESKHFQRFNDVIADQNGNIFAGVMSETDINGGFYLLKDGFEIAKLVGDSQISNGFAFNKSNTSLYWVNTSKKIIYKFDYDHKTSQISNQKEFYSYTDQLCDPDGIATDQDNNLFVAKWEGAGIDVINSRGVLIDKIDLPVKKISSMTFGGQSLDTLYITSAGGTGSPSEALDGSIFCVKTDYKGKLEFRSKIGFVNPSS